MTLRNLNLFQYIIYVFSCPKDHKKTDFRNKKCAAKSEKVGVIV